MVTWHLTKKLFPAKCHERATLRKLWRQTRNSSLLPAKCWPLLPVIRACSWRWPDVVARVSARFSKFPFVLFCYITNQLLTSPLGNSGFCFPKGPVIQDLTHVRRRRQGPCLLKSAFIFHFRSLHLVRSIIQCVCRYWNLSPRWICYKCVQFRMEIRKFSLSGPRCKKTKKLVISRCWFAEDSKEMYKDL